MKTHIKDVLQVSAAIILTSGLVASAAPLPQQVPPENKQAIVKQVKMPEKPVEAPQVPPQPEKVVTWQDNPNHCTDAQYIAEGPPFGCIDKPVAPAPTAARIAIAPTGSCADWIAAAGIGDVANANELIRRESSCNPAAVNPSSGACGVAQELPCGKSGCDRADGACQVSWMNTYIIGRYGSWQAAVNFHNGHNYY